MKDELVGRTMPTHPVRKLADYPLPEFVESDLLIEPKWHGQGQLGDSTVAAAEHQIRLYNALLLAESMRQEMERCLDEVLA